ncbi:hypothetical protein C7B77_05480 [Chamaesiphon polymorphus CCALA 037]|uniref:Uncharacterized protein n=1 Tax=Chamaesiphon polymorphus CCALA 037 TaxID=2107692 RepID=A0A2T1GKC5_9CYAN|nr:hypothetical protein C7B77_05480 [Chamaesiphon polymorphus CCALA 037]
MVFMRSWELGIGSWEYVGWVADAYAFGGAKPYALRFPPSARLAFARLQRALHQAEARNLTAPTL